MNEENIVKLFRWSLGFGCLVLHAATKIDSALLLLAMVLMGVPIELVAKTKKKETATTEN